MTRTLILATAAASFAAVSAVLMTSFWGYAAGDALALVATSHAALFAVAIALASFGALLVTAFADPLDAVACGVGLAVVASGFVLVSGNAVGSMPASLLEFTLATSPLIAMATAAQIDVVRLSVPYQMSALAHVQVTYPTWQAIVGGYLAFATVCLLGQRWMMGRRSVAAAI